MEPASRQAPRSRSPGRTCPRRPLRLACWSRRSSRLTAKKEAGINVVFQTKTFNFLTANYNNQNPAAAKYVNDWGVNNYGGIYTDYYPTQDGLMNPGGALNMGSYNDPQANQLMAASTASGSEAAISNEVKYFSKSYPVFYMPDQDWIMGVSNKVGGPANAFLEMTQQQINPQFLYLVKSK